MAIASYGSGVSRSTSHSATEIAVAASSRRTSTLRNCATNRRHRGTGGLLASSLGPSDARRSDATASVRPRDGSVPKRASASATSRACQGRSADSGERVTEDGDCDGGMIAGTLAWLDEWKRNREGRASPSDSGKRGSSDRGIVQDRSPPWHHHERQYDRRRLSASSTFRRLQVVPSLPRRRLVPPGRFAARTFTP